jgi:dipicolinate synthase subunit A
MLTGVQVVFVGGDARHLEIIQKFIDLDATVVLVGYDKLQNQFDGISRVKLTNEVLKKADALILPAVGTDDNGNVDSIYSNENLVLNTQHIGSLLKHAKIYTGMAKSYLKKVCSDHNIELVELFNRDDVAIYNSIPTAEGALMMAIQHTDITIHASQCMVLGFGRTGFTLARTLQMLGAEVKVGVLTHDHYARAMEMGLHPFYTKELRDQITNTDIIFNTVPDLIITSHVIAHLPHRTVIIDLASKPGGTDFRFAEKRGIKALLAPSLPGLVAPKTAGLILANTLCQLLEEQVARGGALEYIQG